MESLDRSEVMEMINTAIKDSQRDILDKCNDLYVRQSACSDKHEITDSKINSIDTKVEVISVDVKSNSRFQWAIEITLITGFISLIFAATHFM